MSAHSAPPRLLFVDATRGIAMAFVCLSHFGIFYLARSGMKAPADVIARLAVPATTTFMLVSGAVVGMLLSQRETSNAAMVEKLVDRGLFLLGPGHLLLRLAHWQVIAAAPPTSHWLYITDSIGVALIVAAELVPRTHGVLRQALGVALFAGCWMAYFDWKPHAAFAIILKDYFIGEEQSAKTGVIFPVLPWLAFYLVATSLGERIAMWRSRQLDMVPRFARLAAPLLLFALVLHRARQGVSLGPWSALAGIGQKYPPGLAYLMYGAGVALSMLGLIAWLEGKNYLSSVLRLFATVGRASLVVFVAQYFVYYCFFPWLELPASPLWPLYFAASLLVNLGIALTWERFLGNQYLTVGWSWLFGRRRERQLASQRRELLQGAPRD